MSEEREFSDITAEIDEILAQPEIQEELAEQRASMRAADLAYKAIRDDTE